MRIQQSSEQGFVVLTLAGGLDLAPGPQLQRAILMQLSEHPPAIICELARWRRSTRGALKCPPPCGIQRWVGLARPWCCAGPTYSRRYDIIESDLTQVDGPKLS
jgi:hypothetical protein